MSDAQYILDDLVKEVILEKLLDAPLSQNAIAREVGISPLDLMRAIRADAQFAEEFNEAMEIGLKGAEHAAWTRAVEGITEPVLSNGRPVFMIDRETGQSKMLMKTVYSDRMLDRILTSRLSEVYGERAKLDVQGAGVLIAPTIGSMDEFRDLLKQHRDQENQNADEGEGS